MTFSDLKASQRKLIWGEPSLEAENLIGVHNQFFLDAMGFLQKNVGCYQYNNVYRYDNCSRYFNCGMTVIGKPGDRITRVYVIDRVDPTTGLESATGDDSWCQKVFYQQVDFQSISAYMRLCQACSNLSNIATANALLAGVFGIWRRKRYYPTPTDAGFESLPRLPYGFHYAQDSTDIGGRSPSGVYAIYRGRVYVAPWMESTETLVIEADGIKRIWNDADTVEDDPEFLRAVRLYVQEQHEMAFGKDQQLLNNIRLRLYGGVAPDGTFEFGSLPTLMRDCSEQMQAWRTNEAGLFGAARGMGTNTEGSGLFYNDAQTYTARCPAGTTGNDVVSVIAAGTVSSVLSVADANARAYQQAVEDANNRLSCEAPTVTYWNSAQTFTAYCPSASGTTPAADGSSVTKTVPANTYSSTVSQADADALALSAATAQANAALQCTYWNSPQTYTANCPEGTTGTPVTVTIAAHTYSSTVSQSVANSLALQAAQTQAVSQLSCSGGGAQFYWNTQTIGQATRQVQSSFNGNPCQVQVVVNAVVGPGRFSSQNSQQEANAAALSFANEYANSYILTVPVTGCTPVNLTVYP